MSTGDEDDREADRKVLIGYEGEEQGDDALELGRLLCEALAATAIVATVVRIPDLLLSPSDREAALRETADEPLRKARDRLAGLDVVTRAVAGDSPARALHELADEERPLVTVVGSTRRGALGRVLLGSTAERLLTGAPCGVAVAPHGYAGREQRTLQRIGVAIDGGEESWAALAAAASLAPRWHASLTVIAVVEPPRYTYVDAYELLSAGEIEGAYHREMERVLEQARERMPNDVPAAYRLFLGDPADRIIEAAGRLDLLILGSRGYGPIRSTLLGSVSSRVTRSAPCPVLVLPRGAGEDPLHLREESATATT